MLFVPKMLLLLEEEPDNMYSFRACTFNPDECFHPVAHVYKYNNRNQQ